MPPLAVGVLAHDVVERLPTRAHDDRRPGCRIPRGSGAEPCALTRSTPPLRRCSTPSRPSLRAGGTLRDGLEAAAGGPLGPLLRAVLARGRRRCRAARRARSLRAAASLTGARRWRSAPWRSRCRPAPRTRRRSTWWRSGPANASRSTRRSARCPRPRARPPWWSRSRHSRSGSSCSRSTARCSSTRWRPVQVARACPVGLVVRGGRRVVDAASPAAAAAVDRGRSPASTTFLSPSTCSRWRSRPGSA